MHRNTLPSATSGKRKQTPIGTELTLHWPSLSNRPLLEGTWLAQSISNTSVAKLMKADVALGAVGEGVVLFVMRTETPSTSCLQHSLRVLPGLLALLPLHVLLKFTLVSDTVCMLRLNTTVLFKGVQIGIIVKVVNLNILHSYSKILPDQTSHVSVLHSLIGFRGRRGLIGDAITNLLHLLIDPKFILFHQEEKEGDFSGYFRKLFGLTSMSTILPLLLLQLIHEGLTTTDQKGLLQRHLHHLLQLTALEDCQVVPLTALHQDQGLIQSPQLLDQLDVSKQLLEGYLARRKDIGRGFDDFTKRGYFLLQYASEGELFLLINSAFVVEIDLFPPKLLQSDLFLDLALKDTELGRHPQGGEEGISLLEGNGLGRRSLDGFGRLLDGMGLGLGVAGVRFRPRVVLFALTNFQRHIKLLCRPQQLPLITNRDGLQGEER